MYSHRSLQIYQSLGLSLVETRFLQLVDDDGEGDRRSGSQSFKEKGGAVRGIN